MKWILATLMILAMAIPGCATAQQIAPVANVPQAGPTKEDIQKDLQLLQVQSAALQQEERAAHFERESIQRQIAEKQQQLMAIQSKEKSNKPETEKGK